MEAKRYGINADGGLVEAWGADEDAVVLASDYAAVLAASRDNLSYFNCLKRDYDLLRTQLSAAEARLVKAKEWMLHREDCQVHRDTTLVKRDDAGRRICDCGLQAFLEGMK